MLAAPIHHPRLAWLEHHCWQPGEALHQQVARAHSLWLVLDGVVHLRCAAGDWQISAGMACWQSPAQARDLVTPEGAEWLTVGLTVDTLEYPALSATGRPPIAWRPSADERAWLDGTLRRLLALLPCEEAGAPLLRLGLIYTLTGIIANHIPPLSHAVPHWLENLLGRMRAEPTRPVAAWAEIAGYSPAQFRLLFHRYLSISPRAFQQHCLLDAARLLLDTSELPIYAIAEQLGFASHTQFTRRFTRALGLSPTRYRQQGGQPPL